MTYYELHRYDCERLLLGSSGTCRVSHNHSVGCARFSGRTCTCDGAQKLEDLENPEQEEDE